jgi:hypothetical protein
MVMKDIAVCHVIDSCYTANKIFSFLAIPLVSMNYIYLNAIENIFTCNYLILFRYSNCDILEQKSICIVFEKHIYSLSVERNITDV